MDTSLKQIVGYSWEDDVPSLQIRSLTACANLEKIPLSGSFRLTPSAERKCIGRIDFGQLLILPCPYQATVRRGVQCQRCYFEEGFYPCMTCDGRRCPALSPNVEQYCRQTHYLYLANFGGGKVKVGTAAAARKHARIIEQGPVAAAYIAAAPGPTIKQLEKLVSSLGFVERFTRRVKLQLLLTRWDVGAARQRIQDAFEVVAKSIPAEWTPALRSPDFVDLQSSTHAQLVAPPVQVIEVTPGRTIQGNILGMHGSLLFLETVGVRSVVDLSALRSYVVNHNSVGPPMPVQMNLF